MSISVFRKKTSVFIDARNALNIRIKLIPMKRISFGYNEFHEDISNCDVGEILPRILNLNNVDDGLYEIVSCNHFVDKDTGYVEDWDYRLIPYTKERKTQIKEVAE